MTEMKKAESKALPSTLEESAIANLRYTTYLSRAWFRKEKLQSCKAYINIPTVTTKSQIGLKLVIASRKRLHLHFCKSGATHLSKPLAVFKTARMPGSYKNFHNKYVFFIAKGYMVNSLAI
jgi:hypothetical protein